jgi:hypothetical protein
MDGEREGGAVLYNFLGGEFVRNYRREKKISKAFCPSPADVRSRTGPSSPKRTRATMARER